jgi:hypothetical protein
MGRVRFFLAPGVVFLLSYGLSITKICPELLHLWWKLAVLKRLLLKIFIEGLILWLRYKCWTLFGLVEKLV